MFHDTGFSENLQRLAGLHRLSNRSLALLIEVDPATVSLWMNGRRPPQLHLAIQLGELFGISSDRLMTRSFLELLPEVADAERFRGTEARIRRKLKGLEVV